MKSDSWQDLKSLTNARIALGRSGGSQPTAAHLAFRLAHAQARDAVLLSFQTHDLATKLQTLGEPVIPLNSAAKNREEFLLRPDSGRRLSRESREELLSQSAPECPPSLVIIVSDGLSAQAAHQHSFPLLQELLPRLRRDGWNIAPLIVARFGRVALQDEIGELLHSELSLMLLGERPGLGTPDSLGAYFTYRPKLGTTDAERNCVSNIHPSGLVPVLAAQKIHLLLNESLRLKLSGVKLKDNTDSFTLASTPVAPTLRP